tara:strand:- start:1475 stop:2215 length:741 start_codon:yes stop_codon:yes gene_type:complete
VSSLSLERLYHPDGKSLGALVAGLSGSGKTTAVLTTLQHAIRKGSGFGENHRFVIVDPKVQPGDYDLLAEPSTSAEDALHKIRKERVVVLWPDLDFVQEEVETLVSGLFNMADSSPEHSFTFVLDEASILITPSRIPPALKRLAVQGRAKRIKPVFISQRPIVNRWTDANLSTLLLFNTLPVDADTLGKRWGVAFDDHADSIRETPYSFVWFDMEKATFTAMEPVELPKQPTKRKRGWLPGFSGVF